MAKKEYAIYPFEYMNITQRHDEGNHKPHWYGSKDHSDKPWDEACKDSGRSYFAPKNDFLIQQVKGLNTTKTTNSVRCKSVNKLYIPFKSEPDYLYLTLTHMNEDNLKQVKEGQVLKAGSKILMEGTDGQATGNHFHITANIGKYYGLLENSNGKWCWTYEKSLLPDEAFYLDKNHTTIKNAKKYSFKEVPKDEPVKVGTPIKKDTTRDQIEVIVPELNVRNKGTTSGSKLGYANKGIYNILNTTKADGYIWYEIESGKWIAAKEGAWTKFYAKIEIEEEPKVEEPPVVIPEPEPTPIEPPKEEPAETPEEETPKTEATEEARGCLFAIVDMIINLFKSIFK